MFLLDPNISYLFLYFGSFYLYYLPKCDFFFHFFCMSIQAKTYSWLEWDISLIFEHLISSFCPWIIFKNAFWTSMFILILLLAFISLPHTAEEGRNNYCASWSPWTHHRLSKAHAVVYVLASTWMEFHSLPFLVVVCWIPIYPRKRGQRHDPLLSFAWFPKSQWEVVSSLPP